MVPLIDIHLIAHIPDEINVKEKLIKIKPHRKLYFQCCTMVFLKTNQPTFKLGNEAKQTNS